MGAGECARGEPCCASLVGVWLLEVTSWLCFMPVRAAEGTDVPARGEPGVQPPLSVDHLRKSSDVKSVSLHGLNVRRLLIPCGAQFQEPL